MAYVSDKPPRSRDVDDKKAMEEVSHLAALWLANRPHGADVHEMIERPEYQAIIQIGSRAIRPLLILMKKTPEHWFYALHAITGENPVPAESEGRISKMADAWIKWGRKHGYLRDLD